MSVWFYLAYAEVIPAGMGLRKLEAEKQEVEASWPVLEVEWQFVHEDCAFEFDCY